MKSIAELIGTEIILDELKTITSRSNKNNLDEYIKLRTDFSLLVLYK